MNMQPIKKIPVRFNAYYPSQKPDDRTEELGNYDWYLYQYRLKDGDEIAERIQNDEAYRNELPPFDRFQHSQLISFASFFDFLLVNYHGWAPYGKGMDSTKAIQLADNLVRAFLSCDPHEAIYIEYARATTLCQKHTRGGGDVYVDIEDVEAPDSISGIMGIWDQKNKEFFVLIMGGAD